MQKTPGKKLHIWRDGWMRKFLRTSISQAFKRSRQTSQGLAKMPEAK